MMIKFPNQFDMNPFHALRNVGLVFVELVLEDEFLCKYILQSLHILLEIFFASLQSSR